MPRGKDSELAALERSLEEARSYLSKLQLAELAGCDPLPFPPSHRKERIYAAEQRVDELEWLKKRKLQEIAQVAKLGTKH